MRTRIIYFLIALIGTVGFNSCGTQSRTGTTTGTTGNTGTTGTNVGTTTGTTGTTTGTTRTGTNNQTTTTGNRTTTTTGGTTGNTTGTTTGTTTGNNNQNRTATTTGTTTGTNQQGTTRTTRNQQTSEYQLSEDTDYTFGNESYRFSPADNDRINISRTQNGQETPYGDMRRMGDDGYYMINTTSSTGEEETSFGRFDDQGNFTMYRYDRDRDTVFEESFRPGASATSGSGGTNNRQGNN